jgi:hypothetical protein
MKEERAKRMAFGGCCVLLLALLGGSRAFAQFGGIFSAIISTITGPIGGVLTERAVSAWKTNTEWRRRRPVEPNLRGSRSNSLP